MMRERAAPSAERTAISRTRPAPRIKRRFATLAQAIRRRKPTAASNTQRGRRTPSVVSSSMGKTLALQSLLPSGRACAVKFATRSEEHTSELQSLRHLVCRLLLEKKKKKKINSDTEE